MTGDIDESNSDICRMIVEEAIRVDYDGEGNERPLKVFVEYGELKLTPAMYSTLDAAFDAGDFAEWDNFRNTIKDKYPEMLEDLERLLNDIKNGTAITWVIDEAHFEEVVKAGTIKNFL